MAQKILGALAIVIVLFLAVVLTRPSEFKVERSLVMNASPVAVFDQINEFKNWPKWSPWAELDPNMKITMSEPSAGTGATYAWTGNTEVGEGKMTILESQAPAHVKMKLEFVKPFEAVNDTVFTLAPEGNGTKVTWTMSGHNGFMGKLMCLFMDMDKMVGGDFEKGLAKMQAAAEAMPPVQAPAGH